jgi:hypothetical protein
MSSLPIVRVNHKAAERVAAGHLWVFQSDVTDRGKAQPGDAVRVLDPKGRTLALAHYSSTSQITLRLLSEHGEPDVTPAFLKKRIEAAHRLRQLVVSRSNAYRLVYAEGDLLPGLIVDKYGDYLAVQFLDQGMDRLSAVIIDVLSDLFHPLGIVARNDIASRSKENLAAETKVVMGEVPPRVEIEMNSLRWQVDLLEGQKTGIFLDQRENYLAARRYGSGKALDCFTATGGFALHLAGVCESAEGVDSSGIPAGFGVSPSKFRPSGGGSPRIQQIPRSGGRRDTRLQRDQPACVAAAACRGNPGELFLFTSHDRGAPSGSGGRRGTRLREAAAGARATDPGARPSHFADSSRNALPQLPDSASDRLMKGTGTGSG